MENIDIEKLRKDLMDYFEAAMFNGFPAAIVELGNVEKASAEELIEIAKDNKFNLGKYVKEGREYYR